MKSFKTYPGLYRGCKLTGWYFVKLKSGPVIKRSLESLNYRENKAFNEAIQQEKDLEILKGYF